MPPTCLITRATYWAAIALLTACASSPFVDPDALPAENLQADYGVVVWPVRGASAWVSGVAGPASTGANRSANALEVVQRVSGGNTGSSRAGIGDGAGDKAPVVSAVGPVGASDIAPVQELVGTSKGGGQDRSSDVLPGSAEQQSPSSARSSMGSMPAAWLLKLPGLEVHGRWTCDPHSGSWFWVSENLVNLSAWRAAVSEFYLPAVGNESFVEVSWNNAKRFCEAAATRIATSDGFPSGYKLSLPSAAEVDIMPKGGLPAKWLWTRESADRVAFELMQPSYFARAVASGGADQLLPAFVPPVGGVGFVVVLTKE